MPGMLFHTEEAISYFSKSKDAAEAEKKCIYALFPDAIWMLIDGMGYNQTHDLKPIQKMKGYIDRKIDGNTSNPGESYDPWLYLMMAHHLAIDKIADDPKNGYLNGYEKNIGNKLSRFNLPKAASGLIMDIALDLAQYEHSKDSGRTITDIIEKSKESINPLIAGDSLAYGYDSSKKLYIHFAEEVINFDPSELKSAEGMLATFLRYYDSKDPKLKIKLKIGEGKLKNWFKKKAMKIFLKNKHIQNNMKGIINEEKEIFYENISEIHNYIQQHTPSIDRLL